MLKKDTKSDHEFYKIFCQSEDQPGEDKTLIIKHNVITCRIQKKKTMLQNFLPRFPPISRMLINNKSDTKTFNIIDYITLNLYRKISKIGLKI